jgi:hypothetical protein
MICGVADGSALTAPGGGPEPKRARAPTTPGPGSATVVCRMSLPASSTAS